MAGRTRLLPPPETAAVEPRRLPLTLARLADEFLALADALAAADPDDAGALAALQARLDRSGQAIERKAVALAAVIREFEAAATVADEEAKRLASHARRAKARATWLRGYLLAHLQALGIDRVQDATATISVRRNAAPALVVEDEARVPARFKRLVEELDRAALRAALLEDGEVVEGARLEWGAHLAIR